MHDSSPEHYSKAISGVEVVLSLTMLTLTLRFLQFRLVNCQDINSRARRSMLTMHQWARIVPAYRQVLGFALAYLGAVARFR